MAETVSPPLAPCLAVESAALSVDPDETLVLGGIYESKEENIRFGIPDLSSIPLIVRVFQSSQRRAFKSELLIFILLRVL